MVWICGRPTNKLGLHYPEIARLLSDTAVFVFVCVAVVIMGQRLRHRTTLVSIVSMLWLQLRFVLWSHPRPIATNILLVTNPN